MTPRALLLLVVLLTPVTPAAPQSIRITGTTSLRYIELRPLLRDSVPLDATEGSQLLRQLPDGRVVRCVPGEGYCHLTRAGSRTSTIPVIHDLEASAWGLGRGLQLFGHVRGRSALGGGRDLWPRADAPLELMALYGEWQRERLHVRAGRQWRTSGLGFYNFDGVAAAVRATPALWLELYGGRSLLRGISDARSGAALESIEPLAPARSGVLAGVQARYRPNRRLALGALYQLDVRDDRRGLYSELAIVDGALAIGRGSLESSVEVDLAAADLNQARLQFRSPPLGRFVLSAAARRYRPYFELWTIWGAFSPVGFDEVRTGLTWTDRQGRLVLRGDASYRDYGSEELDAAGAGLRDDGWGIGTSVNWTPAGAWRVDGAYRVEAGFGAARWDLSAGIQRDFGDAGTIAMQSLVFQRLYEFRLEEGTVAGFGAEASRQVNDRIALFAGVMVYRHLNGGASQSIDWNQRRASFRAQWTVGAEPGVSRGTRGAR
ncbi:MAG TPA: hypothetical protein VLE53_05545 [Gemmatimonadaceae bacterium]|nr:hypothetical protein [Gemmatimonadaceae bacterium]